MKDLPKFVVRITYKGDGIPVKKASEPDLRAHTRYLYVYPHESLDDRMSVAWRKDAVAEVYETSYHKPQRVGTSKTKGIWE